MHWQESLQQELCNDKRSTSTFLYFTKVGKCYKKCNYSRLKARSMILLLIKVWKQNLSKDHSGMKPNTSKARQSWQVASLNYSKPQIFWYGRDTMILKYKTTPESNHNFSVNNLISIRCNNSVQYKFFKCGKSLRITRFVLLEISA